MANTVTNVTAGKPKVGGSIYVAPVGTTLPTDSTTELPVAWKCLGYASEDGLVNANEREIESIRAWGGDVVLKTVTSQEDNFTFKLIEILNVDVLKVIYGEDNVTGALGTGITVNVNNAERDAYSYIFEMVLRGGVLKRIVIPSASITELGEIEYTDEDAVGYEVTIGCEADASGNTHYEYIKSA